jgi:hypothetical protein
MIRGNNASLFKGTTVYPRVLKTTTVENTVKIRDLLVPCSRENKRAAAEAAAHASTQPLISKR